MASGSVLIWTIAGSDCSGGAGIQADLKTAHALGAEICTLITANTIQNSQSFIAMNPVAVKVLQAQYQALIFDKPPAIVKIGLLASLSQVNWLRETISELRNNSPKIQFVLDPVLKASVITGNFSETLSNAYLELFKIVDVITPNFDEALAINQSMSSTTNKLDAEALARQLQADLQVAVIVKGGHLTGKLSIDICAEDGEIYQVSSLRIDTTYSHGGGCSFSTAISCFLAQGLRLKDALVQAKAFMQKGFFLSTGKTQSYGAFVQPNWPVEKRFYPEVGDSNVTFKNAHTFPSLNADKLGIYPVVDSIAWLEKLLPFDLKIIQLRLKNLPDSKLLGLVKTAVKLFKDSKTRLFINDYWQEAIEFGAYGVHLGQEDFANLNSEEKQQLKDSGIRLGLSSHGLYEYLLAEQVQPSYIAMGAIFPSTSKDMSNQIQGLDSLREICQIKGNIPLVAIGGINKNNLTDVVNTGVEGVAVISAITHSPQFEKDLLEMLSISPKTA